MLYLAVIHKEPGSEYGVSFPDFPGCVTAGKTIDEAKDMAAEALALHIQGMLEDGEAIPAPTMLEDAQKNPDYAGAVYMMVAAPEIASASVRINISLPELVLRGIDRVAKKFHMNRSKFLAQAASHYSAALEGSVQGPPQIKGKSADPVADYDAFPPKSMAEKEWREKPATGRARKTAITTSATGKRKASPAGGHKKTASRASK